ncbi:MAG: hypothetical protein BWX85_00312 [Chloroflexi bacterium ADurb.Bin120]|jgi:putative acetyltransferase|uniref:Acetyltransferase n=1 Tax=Candidatus Brevifilum fermentans TaxID=1986204 RepID=A0A1Y6K0I9_9CHLR|nr:N-acetyltransferase [Brevefilum fermentans]MDI9565573.1 N-acetyltransferase [Chloroflexota bacterium]OQB87555.1 MAG: hypothetical protein BWX85_00312 [Chloroflexi bacterium ADurb.Bin120]SMX53212.1 Acetyltransferase [Brevefilum fermentans]HOM67800.1 N-acetyltransferase [Brevefilum fermentans]
MTRVTQNLPHGINIAEESPRDIDGICHVNQTAFQSHYEANVVVRLRLNCDEICSMVAKFGEQVVGHILFSPVHIVQNHGRSIKGMGLGPLAVLPNYQGKGIGMSLSQAGILRMKQIGYPFVVVLGHPGYYLRFGFTPASAYSIRCAFENIPDEAFMICVFNSEVMQGVKGVAHYRPEFDEKS